MDKLSELMVAHPRLFRGTPPAVASELPADWFDIVNALCRDIEAHLGSEPDRFLVTQIKEKLGGLRFYFSLEGAEDKFGDIHTDKGIRTLGSYLVKRPLSHFPKLRSPRALTPQRARCLAFEPFHLVTYAWLTLVAKALAYDASS